MTAYPSNFRSLISAFVCALTVAGTLTLVSPARAQVLDKQQQLDAQSFWDNRDWDWYRSSIPFFECPDADITTTYYYRWELLTKHLTYGSPQTGYLFTEFIDRPFWSGAYGAISCPAGHQLYEARWLRSPRIARDYARYWFRTPGAQPRNYSTWLADSVWALHEVHPDRRFMLDLLPDLIKNYEGWERRHFVPEVGLFWQTGHDDGMEFNINSRQTKDILRGAPSYRPSFNAYLWADAQAIARIADLAGEAETAASFRRKADSLRERMQALLWDEQRKFFFPMFRDDEERDGHRIRAKTLTYQTGRFAGDPHGRELIGYVPWQFDLLDRDRGYEQAWEKLMDPEAFFAPFGPTTVERRDPSFLLQKSCCWWSGQSWPYATTQTLKALANVLQRRQQQYISRDDYVRLLGSYARTHRKDGRPYLAEACHPDTGSFEGHDGYNHSEHYFHSGFCDLVITGLVGVRPRNETSCELHPLASPDWPWFALDDLPYYNRRVSVVWDRDGTRYGLGAGLTVLVDGRKVGHSMKLESLVVQWADADIPSPAPIVDREADNEAGAWVNFAVNNDGTYFPRVTASHTSPNSSIAKLNDGNYWYHRHPPNRWTSEGSTAASDRVEIDFGVERPLEVVKLYLLDDLDARDSRVRTPARCELEYWTGSAWQAAPGAAGVLERPASHRAVWGELGRVLPTSRLRLTLHHAGEFRSGLTEFEAWGRARWPLAPVPPPAGNLAYNPGKNQGGGEFPRVTASFTSRFDRVESANDGVTNFLPTPNNRWTSYESKSTSDWLEVDFGKEVEFRRVELAIYDDRGGVQAPESYKVQVWKDGEWRGVESPRQRPAKPVGGQWNETSFTPTTARRVRVVFVHHGAARSGVSELMVWNE